MDSRLHTISIYFLCAPVYIVMHPKNMYCFDLPDPVPCSITPTNPALVSKNSPPGSKEPIPVDTGIIPPVPANNNSMATSGFIGSNE